MILNVEQCIPVPYPYIIPCITTCLLNINAVQRLKPNVLPCRIATIPTLIVHIEN